MYRIPEIINYFRRVQCVYIRDRKQKYFVLVKNMYIHMSYVDSHLTLFGCSCHRFRCTQHSIFIIIFFRCLYISFFFFIAKDGFMGDRPAIIAPPESEWYHGRLDRYSTEQRLRNTGKMGSYLVRESDRKPGSYVLSYLGRTGINHFRYALFLIISGDCVTV